MKLASPLFAVWHRRPRLDPMDPHYNAWFVLQRTANIFVCEQTTRLRSKDREMTIAALKLAHATAHDADPEGEQPVETCHCAMSELLRDLAEVLQLGAECEEAA